MARVNVVLVAIAMAVWLLAFTGRTREAAVEPPPSKWDAQLIELDKQALDRAYAQQIRFLFTVWMKDNRGQPGRAVAGAKQARRAYIAVMQEIEKREQR